MTTEHTIHSLEEDEGNNHNYDRTVVIRKCSSSIRMTVSNVLTVGTGYCSTVDFGLSHKASEELLMALDLILSEDRI